LKRTRAEQKGRAMKLSELAAKMITDLYLPLGDFKVERYRVNSRSGAMLAVRVTYLPFGWSAECAAYTDVKQNFMVALCTLLSDIDYGKRNPFDYLPKMGAYNVQA
jgi:hypothetical protein